MLRSERGLAGSRNRAGAFGSSALPLVGVARARCHRYYSWTCRLLRVFIAHPRCCAPHHSVGELASPTAKRVQIHSDCFCPSFWAGAG